MRIPFVILLLEIILTVEGKGTACREEGQVSGAFVCCGGEWRRGSSCSLVGTNQEPDRDQRQASRMGAFELSSIWKLEIPQGTTVDPATWQPKFKTRLMVLVFLLMVMHRAGASRMEMMAGAVLGFGLVHLDWKLAVALGALCYGWKKKKIVWALGGFIFSYALAFGKLPTDFL